MAVSKEVFGSKERRVIFGEAPNKGTVHNGLILENKVAKT